MPDPKAWSRLHRLLKFYQVLDADGAPYVAAAAALPGCPRDKAEYHEAMKQRTDALCTVISFSRPDPML